MSSALIGHTGFVGGNLAQQAPFDDCYNSSNIEAIRGKHYDCIACAGAPGAKWKANLDPEADRASIERLMRCISDVSAAHVILISTVDVYPNPMAVYEDTSIAGDGGSPYGRHRLRLERFIQERFERVSIIRLPGLFGPGLKKNVIYDILHDNNVDQIAPESEFQFYPIVELWKDIEVARRNRLPLVNFATEPTRLGWLAQEAFGLDLASTKATRGVKYDMRTRFAEIFGKKRSYIYEAGEVLRFLKTYVSSMGWPRT